MFAFYSYMLIGGSCRGRKQSRFAEPSAQDGTSIAQPGAQGGISIVYRVRKVFWVT